MTQTRIDLEAALNGKRQSQDKWIANYNSQEGGFKGKRIITLPDFYRAAKYGSKKLLRSLRKDLNENAKQDYFMRIGTGVEFETEVKPLSDSDEFFLKVHKKVIHNFGSSVEKPIELMVEEIPEYDGTPVKDVIGEKGLAYVQALFNTKDDGLQIVSGLEKLSRKSAKDIVFYTLSKDIRKDIFGGARYDCVDLFNRKDKLVISTGWFHTFHDEGPSRGVLLGEERK